MDLYMDALCKEVSAIGRAAAGRKLNTIYIGGGTPTTLHAAQLDQLLSLLEEEFSFDNLLEFTVEAGRPDSITVEKLEVLARHPVTRISVNPQDHAAEDAGCSWKKAQCPGRERRVLAARRMGIYEY